MMRKKKNMKDALVCIERPVDKRECSCYIVDLFEKLLDEKGIEIPCESATEQEVRYEDENTAKLYGHEYWNLVNQIQAILEEIL